jgi:hypothetical protein
MKRIALLALPLLLAPLAVLTGATPAAALPQDPILITPPTGPDGDTYTVEYPIGTVIGNEPSGELHTPADCETIPTCALIPVLVSYPEGYDREVEEYFITVTISWNAGDITVPIPGRPAGQEEVHAQGNDLDNYFFVKELNEDGEEDYREVARAATAANPERARWLGGADEYALVISNYTGPNAGFTVSIKTTPALFDPVFEDLGGGFRPSAPSSSASSSVGATLPDDFSGDLTPGPAVSQPRSPSFARPEPAFSTTPTGLPAFAGDATLDTFGAFGGSSAEFESALDGEAPQLFQPARQVGPPEPVEGSLILFWLGLVPLVLAAAAGVWFWRRRPAALSFATPA